MNEPIHHQFPREEFDYQMLLHVLRNYSHPRDKISDLIRKKIIIRIKKGLYVLGDGYRRHPYSKELLANLIYGPSYISLDYALQYHRMIPERVEAITSITIGRPKRFSTPLGLFIYRGCPLSAYRLGMTRVENEEGTAFLIATAEKALCDKIREDRGTGIRCLKDMRHYLIKELRISEEMLADLDPMQVAEIASRYQSAKIRLLHKIIKQFKLSKDREANDE